MNRNLLSIPAASLLLFVGCGEAPPAGHEGMMSEYNAMKAADSTEKANAAACIGCFEKVFAMMSSGDVTGIEECISENMVEHAAPPPGITTTGLQGLKDIIAWQHGVFPDLKLTILHSAVVGDLAYVHYNQKGTNTGPMGPDMPATGKAIDMNGVDIVRFENGKAVEHWGYWDETKMMQQLGLAPAPGAPPAQ